MREWKIEKYHIVREGERSRR